MPRYVLEDNFHAEWLRKYDVRDAALADLRRLERLTHVQLANEIGQTPCADHCGRRELHIIDETGKEIARANTQDERESPLSG
jgi:hypothetical protein